MPCSLRALPAGRWGARGASEREGERAREGERESVRARAARAREKEAAASYERDLRERRKREREKEYAVLGACAWWAGGAAAADCKSICLVCPLIDIRDKCSVREFVSDVLE